MSEPEAVENPSSGEVGVIYCGADSSIGVGGNYRALPWCLVAVQALQPCGDRPKRYQPDRVLSRTTYYILQPLVFSCSVGPFVLFGKVPLHGRTS